MTTLASLRILLGLESGGVKTGANSVRSDLKAVQAEANNTNATLRNIGKGVQAGFGLGAGLGAFQLTKRAVGELTDFVKDSVNAAIEEEAGIKRLGQSLTANVQAWNGNTAAIEQNIASREALGFSDGELRDSLGALSGATHDVQKAFDLQSLAMDLARFKGEDLASATAELIKVQAGSFRSLKSLGIELASTASSAEAFAAIQNVVAGQAAVFGDTTAGAMAAAGVAVHDLEEDIGAGLAPIIKDVAVGVKQDLIPALRGLGDVLNTLKPGFDLLAGVLGIVSHNTDELAAHAKDLQKDQAAAAISTAATTQAYADYNAAQEQLQQSFRDGKTSQQQYLDQSKALSDEFGALAAATDGFGHVAQDTRAITLQMATAIDQGHTASDAWTASMESAAAETGGLTAAQIAVAQATLDAARAHADLSEAQKDAGQAAAGDMGAVLDLARAQAADKVASDALKKAQDALVTTADTIPPAMLGAGHGTDTFSDALLRVKNEAMLAALGIDAAKTAAQKAWEVFRHSPNKTGDIGGLPTNFETGGDQAGLDEHNRALQWTADFLAEQKRQRDRDAADRLAKAKRNAADVAAAYHDKLGKAFDDTADRAHEAFARIHSDNLKAIDDVRDLANAQLDEQEKAIRGTVDAARAQVQAMRDARHLGDLRGAVSGASTPEELASANRALNDFLTDQRIATLSANADTQIAAIEAEKTKNDTVAALATAAENQRSKDQAAALDKDLAKLKDHLAAYTKEWSKAFADIAAAAKKYHLSDLVGINAPATGAPPKVSAGTATGTAAASVAAGLAPAGDQIIHVIVNVGDEQVADYIDRHLAKKSSRASSGGIAG